MKHPQHAPRGLSPFALGELSLFQPGDHLDVGLVGDVLLSDDLLNQVDHGGRDLRDALWRPLADCSLIVANLEAPITQHALHAESKPYNLSRTSRNETGVTIGT